MLRVTLVRGVNCLYIYIYVIFIYIYIYIYMYIYIYISTECKFSKKQN